MYDVSACSVVLHVHVKQYDMYMWDSTTCACGAVKHVHVKQGCSPGKGTFLPEKAKVQHRAVMYFPHGEVRQTMAYRNADERKFT